MLARAAYIGAYAPLHSSGAQARCDAIQAEFRAAVPHRPSIRRDPPPRPPELVPTGDVLLVRLAEELQYARRMLEQMGDTLSNDPMIIARHMVSLQSVDVIGQMLGHIAKVIATENRDEAVRQMGMGDLRSRLQRRGGI
jgi:hypothetical protein